MKSLRLSFWHFGLWFIFGLLTAACAVRVCLSYNRVAGTDKTPAEITAIAAAVFAGPLAGPVANAAATDMRVMAWAGTGILLGVLALALGPFVLVRRPVAKWIVVAAWSFFIVAIAAWFLAALVSIGMHLS